MLPVSLPPLCKGFAVVNDSPVDCQSRERTDPRETGAEERGGGIVEKHKNNPPSLRGGQIVK